MNLKTINGEGSDIAEDSLKQPLNLDQQEREELNEIFAVYRKRFELITQHFAQIIGRTNRIKGDTYHEFLEGGYCILRQTDAGKRIVYSRVTEGDFFQSMRSRFDDSLLASGESAPDPERPSRLLPAATRTRMRTLDGFRDAVCEEWIGPSLNIVKCKERRLSILTKGHEKQLSLATDHFQRMRSMMQPGDTYRLFATDISHKFKNLKGHVMKRYGECIVRPLPDGLRIVYSRTIPGWHLED